MRGYSSNGETGLHRSPASDRQHLSWIKGGDIAIPKIQRPFVWKPVKVRNFLDSLYRGGGWGPISTPTLLSSGRMEPRKIIGTVDTSEFVVASCASVGFLLALSLQQIPWQIVGALLAGGVIAAPIAAWVVRILPMRILGTSVGGIILVTNMQTFLNTVGISDTLAQLIYALIVTVWMVALAFSILVNHQEKVRAALESQSA